MERSAKALVQSTRAVAYAGRVTPRGFTVINGGARVVYFSKVIHKSDKQKQ